MLFTMKLVYCLIILTCLSVVVDVNASQQAYITTAQCSARNGVRFRNWCYTSHSTTVTWNTANANCIAAGGQLASIYTLEENNFLYNLSLSTLGSTWVWFGLSDLSANGRWIWSDLPQINAWVNNSATNIYSKWNPGEPNYGFGGGPNCGQMVVNSNTWNDAPCTMTWPYLCKQAISPLANSYCSTVGGTIVDACYYLGPTSSTWVNGVTYCRATGGDIATIPSSSVAATLRPLFSPASSIWIGLNDLALENRFVYADSPNITISTGSSVASGQWAPWDSSQPNGGTTENCVEWLTNGNIADVGCYNNNRRPLCRFIVNDVTPPTVTCPANINLNTSSATVVTWTAITATDASGIASGPTLVSSPSGYNNGSTFPVGTYVMTYSATDNVGFSSSCSFTITVASCSAAFVPTLLANESSIINGVTLDLAFASSTAYVNTTFGFVGAADATCNSTSATYWTTTPPTIPSFIPCTVRYEVLLPLNFALAQCGFSVDESTAATTTYSARVLMTSTQLRTTSRGLAITQTMQTSVTVSLRFSTAITASSGSLQVYGPRITFSRVVSQSFNPANYVATLQVFTSVQFPYQLTAPALTNVAGFTTTVTPTVAESGRPTTAICNGTTSPCSQYWTVTIQRTTSCSPAPTNLNYAGWNLGFTVNCHSSFTGQCNTPDPSSDAVVFDTSSDNYCPNLLGTIATTAALSTFSDAGNTSPNSQFVFGARTFFRALVTSQINIAALRIERISIVSGAAASVSNLYVNTFTNAVNFFDQNKAGTYNNHVSPFTGTFAASPTLMQMTENQSTGSVLTRAVTFNWVWSGATSSANTDNAVATVVQVDLRVRYQNQSLVADHSHIEKLSLRFNPLSDKMVVLANDEGSSASVSVAVIGANDDNNNNSDDTSSSSSSSSTSLSSSIIIGLVAATVAAVIVVAVVVAVVLRQRNIKVTETAKNKESIDLSNLKVTSSEQNLNVEGEVNTANV